MELTTTSIWSEFRARLFAFIRARVKETADAEDLLQETFVRIHRALPGLGADHKLQAWLYAIARNVVNDHYRAGKRVVTDEFYETSDAPAANDGQFQECMMPFIEKLPEKYRSAIEYCDLGGGTQWQLAQRENISLPGAKSRLQRARRMLRNLFEQCCEIETDPYGNVVDHVPKGVCACA